MSKKNNKPISIYFTHAEAKAIVLGIATNLESIMTCAKDPSIPLTPDARKTHREIIEASRSAAQKIENLMGVKCDLPPYIPGDEDEFLTKPS